MIIRRPWAGLTSSFEAEAEAEDDADGGVCCKMWLVGRSEMNVFIGNIFFGGFVVVMFLMPQLIYSVWLRER